MARDDFDSNTKEVLAKRAAFICSNPDCKGLTVAAVPNKIDAFKFIGVAAHIYAAAPGGARYKASMTPEQRASIENAIFLCASCSVLIDKNKGIDFSDTLLLKWKSDHEIWVRSNLNKKTGGQIVIVDGEHSARGVGTVTGLEIKGSAILKPGTRSSAEGFGNITGTKIG